MASAVLLRCLMILDYRYIYCDNDAVADAIVQRFFVAMICVAEVEIRERAASILTSTLKT